MVAFFVAVVVEPGNVRIVGAIGAPKAATCVSVIAVVYSTR